MNKSEAKTAIERGKRVTHVNFTPTEWVTVANVGMPYLYEFEDGVDQYSDEFWNLRTDPTWQTGWRLFRA